MPLYNGGLFITRPDADDHTLEGETARFLASHKIPDRYLALGLDLLTRDLDDRRQDLVFIDYKSLGVRQLGSIYEGLLEFTVRIAEEQMAVVKGRKTVGLLAFRVVPLEEICLLAAVAALASYGLEEPCEGHPFPLHRRECPLLLW